MIKNIHANDPPMITKIISKVITLVVGLGVVVGVTNRKRENILSKS